MTSLGTVLILDDSLTVRMDLVEAFRAAGWTPEACATAAEAWSLLASRRVDLIVLDVLMPDVDGVDVLRALRSDPSTVSLPVIMLSTEAEVADRIRGLRTGADEYVGKPYDCTYVLARAQELVPARGGHTAARRQVVVIDDSATIRERMRDLLEGNGYEVVVAASGLAGLRLVAAGPADAVVIDGNLPDIDGATVIRRLRLDAALRGIPCLLLTGSDDFGAELAALEAGADAFLRKDEDDGVVLAHLAAALRRTSGGDTAVTVTSLLSSKKVLVIGDDSALLASLTHWLGGEDYDVVAARTEAEALELMAFQTMDCILLQLVGQGIDGLQMCDRIKSTPGLRYVPLILMAVTDDQQTMVSALAAGADDYIPAFGDTQVLAARIRTQLRRKQLEDEHRQLRETLLRREIEATETRAAAEIARSKTALVEVLESKNRELEAFSYSVSHDLRAPLRTVSGFTRALVEGLPGDLDEKSSSHVARIHGGVARMTEMIDDMLELSRVGRAPVRRCDVDVTDLAASVLADLARSDPDRHVTTVVEPALRASADARLIRNVFENLIGNAWKFTARTPAATVEVGSEFLDGQTTYVIRDNGSGFNMARAGLLFTAFQRMHTEAEFPGTGIGLATVHRIIDRHGGRIWAEAEIGRGATFRFTLPY
jgi:two-component system NtrC family sensor kinase